MSSQEPYWNFTVTCGVTEMGQTSRTEDRFDFPDSCETQPNSWLQTSRSLDTFTSEMEDFQVFFGSLLDVPCSAASPLQADISIPSELENSCEPGKSSGTKRELNKMVLRKCYSDVTEASEELKIEQNNRPKRTRSAKVHNMSERMRRDRINRRLRTLQELIPNCSKTDRASVLDDAVNYLKSLKHQVEIMSASRGAILQASYMSTSGVQSNQVPQLPHFVSMTPELGMASGFGMGLAGICYSPGFSMSSVPSCGLHPSFGAGVGFPVMSAPRNLVFPQVQMPSINSQTVHTFADISARLPNFFTGFSPAFSFSSQEESGSQAIPSIGMNHQLPQMINQESHPSVPSSTMPISQKTTSSMIENVVSEAS